MSNVTVIGAQWGDEGKGKIVDWLSNRADIVVRFQGGNNAGHTIVVGDKTYKLSRCCLRASYRANAPSSETAWWWIPGHCSRKSHASALQA